MSTPAHSPHQRPRVFQDHGQHALQHFLEATLRAGELRRVLDAGCGRNLPIDFPREVTLVGLDTSEEALAENENLDEAIVGDIATYPFSPGSFDAVLCWWVLEHLPRPRMAVQNLAQALRPGGLLIVGVPNLWSLKALLTKLTPFRFHVWAHKHLLGTPHAGEPGFGPYPTYLRLDVAPGRLEAFARSVGLEPVYSSTYRGDNYLPGALRLAWSAAGALGRLVTLRRWDPEASEHIAVFRKALGTEAD